MALLLARNLGSAAKLSTVATDAGLGKADSKSATNKAAAHIAALQDLYVIEQVTGWDAPIRSKTRLRTKPKRYFADPSLAASLLQVSPERLLSDGQLFGLLFESLCIHDLSVYASDLPISRATCLPDLPLDSMIRRIASLASTAHSRRLTCSQHRQV